MVLVFPAFVRSNATNIFKVLAKAFLALAAFALLSLLYIFHRPHKTVITSRKAYGNGGAKAVLDTTEVKEPIDSSLIGKYIREFVSHSSGGLYNISIEDIKVDPAGEISLAGVAVWPDEQKINELKARHNLPCSIASITLPKVRLTGVIFSSLVTNHILVCDSLVVLNPQEKFTKYTDNAAGKDTKNDPFGSERLKKCLIGHVLISGLNITVICPVHNSQSYIEGEYILLNNMKMPVVDGDPPGLFFAESGVIKLRRITSSEPGETYITNAPSFEFASRGDNTIIKNLTISSIEDNSAYDRKLGMDKVQYAVQLKEAVLHNFSWRRLAEDHVFAASSATLTELGEQTFLRRTPPPDTQSKVERFPQQILYHLKTQVNIPVVNIRNANVTYTEMNKMTHRAGGATFNDINGTIENITNIASVRQARPHCIARLGGKYNGKSPVNANFDFMLNDTDGSFTFSGQLTGLDADQISKDAQALSLTDIKSVHISRLDLSVRANQWSSRGSLTMQYDHLKVGLDKMTKKDEMKPRRVGTVMANHVYLYTDNPMPGGKLRTGTSQVSRNRMRSFFGLIFTNLRECVDKTVVKDQELAENIATMSDGRKHKKKGVFKAFFKSVGKRGR
ncbi:MAG: hypothetical protein JWQ38_911 [Flavipsychrobacter sp.]|nr:hypothetical protein [Flavipsychrobacter sp.]